MTKTSEWVAYAQSQNLLRSVPPRVAATCRRCYGVVGYDDDGSPYSTCYACSHYIMPPQRMPTGGIRLGGAVPDLVVPVTYSLDEGLESLLHEYKGGTLGSSTTKRASLLGSVLHQFLGHHLQCITAEVGPITIATSVPPRKPRDFRPMSYAIARIGNADGGAWGGLVWDHDLVQRIHDQPHRRGVMDATFYELAPGKSVANATVLVTDDTWTSGASMASVAKRLREAGAAKVVAVPIGRQIGSDSFGSTQQARQVVAQRSWDPRVCVLCG